MDRYETFEVTAESFENAPDDTWMAEWMRDEGATADGLAGFYWWFCEPGCLPDGEPSGPFKDHHEACKAATFELRGDSGGQFTVIVGNIGTVVTTDDRREASEAYNEYVALSKRQSGRAAGEDVTITDGGEPIREYIGK